MHGHENVKCDYVKTSPRPCTDQLHNNNASNTIPLIFHQYEDFLSFVRRPQNDMVWMPLVSFFLSQWASCDWSFEHRLFFSPLTTNLQNSFIKTGNLRCEKNLIIPDTSEWNYKYHITLKSCKYTLPSVIFNSKNNLASMIYYIKGPTWVTFDNFLNVNLHLTSQRIFQSWN